MAAARGHTTRRRYVAPEAARGVHSHPDRQGKKKPMKHLQSRAADVTKPANPDNRSLGAVRSAVTLETSPESFCKYWEGRVGAARWAPPRSEDLGQPEGWGGGGGLPGENI